MAMLKPLLACSLLALLAGPQPAAQGRRTATIRVSETSGIRRTEYPVRARVSVPQRALADGSHVRLRVDDGSSTAVPAQYTVAAKWPDASVQSLDVDFNVTLAPAQMRTYLVEYGPDVAADAAPRGLAVTEDAAVIQVGNVKFNRSGAPLMSSATYVRSEFIGQFPEARNGFAVIDRMGTRHDLSTAEALNAEIIERGPLAVVLRYSGSLSIGAGYAVPFTLMLEMPNSKSWVKLSASVNDPGRRVREIAWHTPLALGAQPWVWDFGTTRWTYGALRNPADSVVMSHAAVGDWTVSTGPKGREQLYETSSIDRSTFGGWGHVQGAKEVVAFAIEGMSTRAGTYRVAIDGEGQTSFRVAAAAPQLRHELTVYEHFVSTPVQIGAATSPATILSPLLAVCDREQYTKSGVPVPASVR